MYRLLARLLLNVVLLCTQDVFTAKSLQSRWYMVLGNHDHYGNASAEIDYTNHSDRWYLPNYYYTEVSALLYNITKVTLTGFA